MAAVTRDIEATLAGTGLAGCRDRSGLGRDREGLADAARAWLDAALALQTARAARGPLPPGGRPLVHPAGARHGRHRHGPVGCGAYRRPRHGQPIGPRGARALDQCPEPPGRAGRGGPEVRARSQPAADQQGGRAARRCRARSRRCMPRPRASMPACACCLGAEADRPVVSGEGAPRRRRGAGPRGRAARRADRPGETEYVQLVLERPIAAAAGDRFVIRDTSSSRTVGGGILHRRARPRAAPPHAGAARPDRRHGGARSGARARRSAGGTERRGSISTPSCATARWAAQAVDRDGHELVAGHVPARRPVARRMLPRYWEQLRDSASAAPLDSVPYGAARAPGHRPRAIAPRRRSRRCPLRFSWRPSGSSPRPATWRSTARGCAGPATR